MPHLTFAILAAQGWRPGFGDNDFLGWVITAAYFAVAGLCAWAGRNEIRLLRAENRAAQSEERPAFWFVLCALLVVMGFNKQLDLQTWVLRASNDLLREGGLAGHRLLAMGLGLLTLALAGAGILLALVRYIGRPWRRYLMAFVGLLYLGFFVVLRAGSFLPEVGALSARFYDEIHLVFELGAVLMIGACAARAVGRESRRRAATLSKRLSRKPVAGGRLRGTVYRPA